MKARSRSADPVVEYLEFDHPSRHWTARVLPHQLAGVGGLRKNVWRIDYADRAERVLGPRFRKEPLSVTRCRLIDAVNLAQQEVRYAPKVEPNELTVRDRKGKW